MRNLIVISLIFFSLYSYGQELNCKVTINADQVQTSDRSVFKDMERAIAAFLNTRKWTTDTYKNYERINCSIFLNISQMPSIGSYKSSAQITSSRPIYDTNYETVMLNFADRDFEFEYIESQPMEYNDNAYITNLTSMLAFYAYVILATDYDSFSETGGTPYVQKALNVINNAQSSGRPGWTALESSRSRYALLNDMNNPQLADMRKNSYKYHRLAMDTFDKTPDQSRDQVLDVLKNVKKVWSIYPNSILVISFFDSKANELANMYSEGTLQVRRDAYDILSALDPKRTVYQKIVPN